MSYILDALRKADAQRERDPARGIHAQPQGLPAVAIRRPWRRPLAWAVGGVAVIAAALAAGMWRTAPAPAVPPAPVAAASVPQPLPVVPAPAAMIANEVQPAPPPAPALVPVPAPVARKADAPAPATAEPPKPGRVLTMAELPADVQRDVPKLAISGGVYSENAAQRMLIVSGQVMAEGAELAPGLVLERIQAKSAVLKFRGYRFSTAY